MGNFVVSFFGAGWNNAIGRVVSLILIIGTLSGCQTTWMMERHQAQLDNLPPPAETTIYLVDLPVTNAPSSVMNIHGINHTMNHFPALSDIAMDVMTATFSDVQVVAQAPSSGTAIAFRDFYTWNTPLDGNTKFTMRSRVRAEVYHNGVKVSESALTTSAVNYSSAGYITGHGAHAHTAAMAFSGAARDALSRVKLAPTQAAGPKTCSDHSFMVKSASDYRKYQAMSTAALLRTRCANYTKADAMLTAAVLINDREKIKRLLLDGVDPSSVGPNGMSALHIAALRSSSNVIALLSAYASDKRVKNKDGLAPRDIAVMKDRVDILAML